MYQRFFISENVEFIRSRSMADKCFYIALTGLLTDDDIAHFVEWAKFLGLATFKMRYLPGHQWVSAYPKE